MFFSSSFAYFSFCFLIFVLSVFVLVDVDVDGIFVALLLFSLFFFFTPFCLLLGFFFFSLFSRFFFFLILTALFALLVPPLFNFLLLPPLVQRYLQAGSHDEAEYLLRHRLFEELLKEEKFLGAANCLGKLSLDSSGGKARCRFTVFRVIAHLLCMSSSHGLFFEPVYHRGCHGYLKHAYTRVGTVRLCVRRCYPGQQGWERQQPCAEEGVTKRLGRASSLKQRNCFHRERTVVHFFSMTVVTEHTVVHTEHTRWSSRHSVCTCGGAATGYSIGEAIRCLRRCDEKLLTGAYS